MSDLSIKNLRSGTPGLSIPGLQALDLVLHGMEITVLNGPSGSGKSLLLRAIADLDPSSGEVWLGNESRVSMKAHEWRKRVCYLPTESAWWFETVGEHFPSCDMVYINKLGFDEDVLSWKIGRISSGEKQRLALARCLSRTPDVLLLDEPTASLDEARALLVEEMVADYSERRNVPVLWVSHNRKQINRIAHRLITIDSDGYIEELTEKVN
jgi:ABC-type iron transport system FetAB ATPase subunit